MVLYIVGLEIYHFAMKSFTTCCNGFSLLLLFCCSWFGNVVLLHWNARTFDFGDACESYSRRNLHYLFYRKTRAVIMTFFCSSNMRGKGLMMREVSDVNN